MSNETRQVDKKTRAYSLRYFGIELKEPALTRDEEILLMRVREEQNKVKRDDIYRPPRVDRTDLLDGGTIDIEFSILCSNRLV